MAKTIKHKKKYFDILNKRARNIAKRLSQNKKVSHLLLEDISQLYDAANTEKEFDDDDFFQSAYHQPITSELEFLMARIFFHYSKQNDLGWEIHLRKQKKDIETGKMVAPDIKIMKNGKIIVILLLYPNFPGS